MSKLELLLLPILRLLRKKLNSKGKQRLRLSSLVSLLSIKLPWPLSKKHKQKLKPKLNKTLLPPLLKPNNRSNSAKWPKRKPLPLQGQKPTLPLNFLKPKRSARRKFLSKNLLKKQKRWLKSKLRPSLNKRLP